MQQQPGEGPCSQPAFNPYTAPVPSAAPVAQEPPDRSLVRRGLRRFRRRGRVTLIVTLLVLGAGVAEVAASIAAQPQAPPGGSVVYGDVVSITPYGDVWALKVSSYTGRGQPVISRDRPTVEVGDTIDAAVDQEGFATEIRRSGGLADVLGILAAILAGLFLLLQLPAATRRAQIAHQIRRHDLVVSDAQVRASSARDGESIGFIGLSGAIVALLVHVLLVMPYRSAFVLDLTHPYRVRGLIAERRVPFARLGPVSVPVGVNHPLAAVAVDGTILPIRIRGRSATKGPRGR